MYFHFPRLLAKIRSGQYRHDRPFFCSLMALCAMVTARVADGVPNRDAHDLLAIPTEVYHQACLNAFPSSLDLAPEFDYKRAKSYLALLGVQYGDIRALWHHLGDYMTLCAMDGFHLEARWPQVDRIELEERRRVVRARNYTADVVLGHISARRVRGYHVGRDDPASRERNDRALPRRGIERR